MDTSETYIKMCRKASAYYCPGWVWRHGDFAYSFYHHQIGVIDERQYFRTATISALLLSGALDYHRIIPLPRQDQVQAMVKGQYVDSCPRKLAKMLWDWIAETAPMPDESMEQLWLAFVMKELYHKRWSGRDWILNYERGQHGTEGN